MGCVSSTENSPDEDRYEANLPIFSVSRQKSGRHALIGDIGRKRKGIRKKSLLDHLLGKRRASTPLQVVPEVDEDEDRIPLQNVRGALDLNDPYNDDPDDLVPDRAPARRNFGSYPLPTSPPAEAPGPSSQPTGPYRFQEPCQSCKNGLISYRNIKAALVEKSGIFKFKTEDGKFIYSHIKFPENHQPLSRSSETTLRRRADLVDGLLSLVVAEEDEDQLIESKARLYWKYLQRNPEIQQIIRQQIKRTNQETIPTRIAARLLAQLVSSKNKAEKLMSAINEATLAHVGRIFGIRQDYRDYMTECELGAVYKTKTVHVYLEDKIESIPVAYMKNIQEVLNKYANKLQNKMEISDRTGNSLYVRLGLDKGGLDTKLSLSFANCEKDQSPFNQLVVAAYTGPDTYQFLKETVSKTLKKIQDIKEIKVNGANVPVQLFLVGDNMSLSALIGHSGPCCTHPCQICTVDLLSLRRKVDIKNSEMRKEKARLGKGINQEPLIGAPSSNIGPSVLHNLTGLITMLLQLITDDSTYCDQQLLTNKPIKKEDLPSQQEKKAIVKPNGMLPSKEFEKRKKIITDFLSSKTVKKDDSKKKNKEAADTCSAEWCYKKIGIKVLKKFSELSTCETCHKQHHFVCNGIIDPHPDLEHFVCAKCVSNGETTREILFKSVLNDLENSYTLAQSVLKESKSLGFVGHLNSFMSTNHIERQLYQGGILRGNDAHRLVENIEEALDKFLSFEHNDPVQEQIVIDRGVAYLTMGQALYRISSLCTNDFLGPDQLEVLKNQIAKFSAGMKLVPGFHLTLKCHHIKEHFLQFAERWKTLGKFSESYIESGHVHWNLLSLNVGNRSRGGYRLRYIIRHVNVRSLILFQSDVEEDFEEDPEID